MFSVGENTFRHDENGNYCDHQPSLLQCENPDFQRYSRSKLSKHGFLFVCLVVTLIVHRGFMPASPIGSAVMTVGQTSASLSP